MHVNDAEGASPLRTAYTFLVFMGVFPLFPLFPLFFDSAGLQMSRHIVPFGYCDCLRTE